MIPGITASRNRILKIPPTYIAYELAKGDVVDISVNVPTHIEGDILVVFYAKAWTNAATTVTPNETGWTLNGGTTGSANSFRSAVYSRVATASEPASYQFNSNITPGEHTIAYMVSIRGSSGVGVTSHLSTKSATRSCTGLTPATSQCLMLGFMGVVIATLTSPFYPSGQIGINRDGTGGLAAFDNAASYEILPTTVATGTRTWFSDTNNRVYAAALVTLEPPL